MKKRLRQKDPLSPYLFVLIITVFTSFILQKRAGWNGFMYHPKSNKSESVSPMLFVDDQLIFYAANKDSIEANGQFLVEVKALFGLATNVGKFEVSFSEVSAEVKDLRVPLISRKTNCRTL